MHYEFVKAVVQDAGNAIIALDRILQRADALSDADISLFTTTVHGMKSPLAELGETELSNNAYRLEQKGCSRNISAIVSETPVFINDLRLFIEKSKPERTGNVSGISRDDITMLKVKLGEIKKACEEYDIRTVKSMMTGLKRREWPDALEDKISEMAWDLTRGDYDKVAYTAWIASELSDTLPPTDE
jgi:HPt (histidine-containing phosphotransfer) domain-containing protein